MELRVLITRDQVQMSIGKINAFLTTSIHRVLLGRAIKRGMRQVKERKDT